MRGRFMQAADVAGDLLGIAGLVFCIPFVILAIGTPIVLSVAFLAWLVGLR